MVFIYYIIITRILVISLKTLKIKKTKTFLLNFSWNTHTSSLVSELLCSELECIWFPAGDFKKLANGTHTFFLLRFCKETHRLATMRYSSWEIQKTYILMSSSVGCYCIMATFSNRILNIKLVPLYIHPWSS